MMDTETQTHLDRNYRGIILQFGKILLPGLLDQKTLLLS
jgi:hypothetical protein